MLSQQILSFLPGRKRFSVDQIWSFSTISWPETNVFRPCHLVLPFTNVLKFLWSFSANSSWVNMSSTITLYFSSKLKSSPHSRQTFTVFSVHVVSTTHTNKYDWENKSDCFNCFVWDCLSYWNFFVIKSTFQSYQTVNFIQPQFEKRSFCVKCE